MRCLGRLPDTGTHHHILRHDIQLGQCHFDDIEDRKITTARAPGHVRLLWHVVEFLVDHNFLDFRFKIYDLRISFDFLISPCNSL